MQLATALLALALAVPARGGHVFRLTQEIAVVAGDGVTPVASAASSPLTITVPEYTDRACAGWLATARAADLDGSGGLSADEFHAFLAGIDDPPHVGPYFEREASSYLALPWLFKVAHKALACKCHALGLGEGCCEGAGAEIPFAGLTEDASQPPDVQQVQREFRADVCNSVAAVFEEVIPAEPCELCPADGPPLRSAVVIPDMPEPTTCGQTSAFAASLIRGEADCDKVQLTAVRDICCGTPAPTPAPTARPTSAPTPAPVPAATTSAATTAAATTSAAACAFCPAGGVVADRLIPERVGETCGQAAALAAALVSGAPDCTQVQQADPFCCTESTDPTAVVAEPTDAAEPTAPSAVTTEPAATTEPTEPVVVVSYPPAGGITEPTAPLATTPAPPVSLALDVVASSLDYSSFDYSVIFQNSDVGVPEFLNAAEITAGDRGVLVKVVEAFEEVAGTLADVDFLNGAERRGLRGRVGRGLQFKMTLKPVNVTDIPCPGTVPYAPRGALCLNFEFAFYDPDPVHAPTFQTLMANLDTAINDEGQLYTTLLEQSPAIPIHGMGAPGKGVAYAGNPFVGNRATVANESADPDDGSLSNLELVLVILAVLLIPIALLGLYAHHKKKGREDLAPPEAEVVAVKAPAAPLAVRPGDGGSDAPSVLSEEDSGGFDDVEGRPKSMTPGSALAAIGVAGAAAATGAGDDMAAIRKEVKQLVKETHAPKSAEELLRAYAGREGELLKHLRKMKVKLDQQTEIKALVAATSPGKSYEELMATYAGKEDALIKNLRKMRAKQLAAAGPEPVSELEGKRAEIRALVASTGPGKGAEELFQAYEGREDELIKNLTKLQAEQTRGRGGPSDLKATQRDSVKALVDRVQPGKTAEELLQVYDGREDELIKNLTKMQSKQDLVQAESRSMAAKRASVKALVDSTQPGKSAEELLQVYDGREDELVDNLTKMQSKQDLVRAQQASVKALVDTTQPGKSAEELLQVYDGREDELIDNLTKMKAKQDLTQVQAASTAAKTAEVTALVESLALGKSAEEMLAAYADREDELIKNLRTMQAKQQKDAQRAEITALVAGMNTGKSAEELLDAYEGKEDDLLKNLKQMQASGEVVNAQTPVEIAALQALAGSARVGGAARAEDPHRTAKRASIRALVTEVDPGKTAEELLTAYDGKEDDLIKNLEKMKAKKERKEEKKARMVKRESIKALVTEVNPGKSAEELLAAYDGKEDDLIKNLEKMKAKKERKQKRDTIRELVGATNPGKSAEELLTAYDGKEDELIKNLSRMQEKQEKNRAQSEKKQDRVRALVEETSPGKSADDLLAAYQGREEELITHLSKLKSSGIKL